MAVAPVAQVAGRQRRVWRRQSPSGKWAEWFGDKHVTAVRRGGGCYGQKLTFPREMLP